ncbi:PucR C-terminal helix-turn-helix domain-containing protein [Streptococcus equinus]|uniref:PucR C-terminal helix-turn-helix domain-containing protein n=1 Tax=Streptococcus equinus TaxID=1335 RepID=A0A239RCL2_STREI|nr:helix-turn-helix domain-containing protein [Streptococcus equinus]SDQ36687.1 PucR C-terminal helix-turn-helix domain-containing protein [Streptococcus equinus]SNU08381.1 PucR C-terminal helix-turn-helix domain-containing protein [Streptococcus equinus]
MSLESLFPEAVGAEKVEHADDWVAVEENGQTFYLPLASLSEREKALLTLKNDGVLDASITDNPWYRYLVQNDTSASQGYKCLQIIYIDHKELLPEELFEFFETLLPNMLAHVVISKNRTLLILNQEETLEAQDLVKDVLPTLESDFGLKLTVFFGNIWNKLQADELPLYYQEESRLFANAGDYLGNERTVAFSEMLLLAYAHQLDLPAIKHKILQAIDDNKDTRMIITTMWQEQGNLAKTAQSLYIHRNSLHYKLEKFRLASGLNLKNLNDLAFVYLLIMEN